jgi:hypothetical protein
MSIVENYHAAHKARLLRLGAPSPYQAPLIVVEKPPVKPQAFNAGWEEMWFHDLVTIEPRFAEPPKVEEIQRAVCQFYGVSKIDLLSKRRTANICRPRQIAMYLAKTLTFRSLPEVGRKFGGRDHTTVLHAVRKITLHVAVDVATRNEIRLIKAAIR